MVFVLVFIHTQDWRATLPVFLKARAGCSPPFRGFDSSPNIDLPWPLWPEGDLSGSLGLPLLQKSGRKKNDFPSGSGHSFTS